MPRRPKEFLPIVLLALVVQILAPIAACWAVGIDVAVPLQSAGICHSDATTGPGDQNRKQHAHDGLCAICVTHAGIAGDAPRSVALVLLVREFRAILWADANLTLP